VRLAVSRVGRIVLVGRSLLGRGLRGRAIRGAGWDRACRRVRVGVWLGGWWCRIRLLLRIGIVGECRVELLELGPLHYFLSLMHYRCPDGVVRWKEGHCSFHNDTTAEEEADAA